MKGRIVQISVSNGGVPKLPVLSAYIDTNGMHGDRCAHPRIHGGPRQAVLLITMEAIEELRAAGFPVYAGALGENLTIAGIDRRSIRTGQQFRAGGALLEISKLRAPCAALDCYNPPGLRIQTAIFDRRVKAGDPASPRWGMAGFYARVLSAGPVQPNDIIELHEPLHVERR